jgi:hypothetical protein
MRPPLRSTPPQSGAPFRYLGRGGGERPVRVQIILALVAALVLVAVPLYLWRRPQPATIPSADAATSGQAPPVPGPTVGAPGAASTNLVGATTGPSVEVGPVKTLKCQDPGPGRTPPERCDGIRFFEDGLTRAIKDSAACAPPSRNGYVVSYVLEFHFGKKRTNLFLGKSTTLSKSKRKELLKCIERGLPTPDWDRIPHQHLKYTVNTVATYPPSDALDDQKPPSGGPAGASSDRGGSKKAPSKPAAPKKAAPKKKAPAKKND